MFESLLDPNPALAGAPITRSPEEQGRVDEGTRTLALYHYEACWFSARVRRAIEHLQLKIDKRDIMESADHRRALAEGGGRSTVPCLRIQHGDGQHQWLYESAAIIDYLLNRFGPPG